MVTFRRRSARFTFTVAATVAIIFATHDAAGQEQRKAAGETLRIVTDHLVKTDEPEALCTDCAYAVKGSIYNPNDVGVANVVIRYRIWGKYMGQDGRGSLIKDTGGQVIATIKYLPPKQTLDFLAGGRSPVRQHEVPDPLNAEITGDWADQ